MWSQNIKVSGNVQTHERKAHRTETKVHRLRILPYLSKQGEKALLSSTLGDEKCIKKNRRCIKVQKGNVSICWNNGLSRVTEALVISL